MEKSGKYSGMKEAIKSIIKYMCIHAVHPALRFVNLHQQQQEKKWKVYNFVHKLKNEVFCVKVVIIY
jgi:hypothetical protein